MYRTAKTFQCKETIHKMQNWSVCPYDSDIAVEFIRVTPPSEFKNSVNLQI